jgi:zinc transport system substrate-binding protein
MNRVCRALAITSISTLFVAGCGSGGSSGSSASGNEESPGGKIPVTASFYPLQEAVEKVGGDRVQVTSLTPPGAEPHELELNPRSVADLAKSSLVVYLEHFQPAVDQAVATVGADRAFDVSKAARLDLSATEEGHDHATPSASASDHAHEGATDPHFWLDPTRYADVVTAVGERLAAVDAPHAADYRARAKDFVTQLQALDQEFSTGLKTCHSKDIVTGHTAFGYLAQHYDLTQEGIAGLSPESEPTPAQLADLVAHVREHKVGTVYAETLVSPLIVQTLARETGAKVEVLDPIEGVTKESKGTDYLSIMRSNLETLRKGQDCS